MLENDQSQLSTTLLDQLGNTSATSKLSCLENFKTMDKMVKLEFEIGKLLRGSDHFFVISDMVFPYENGTLKTGFSTEFIWGGSFEDIIYNYENVNEIYFIIFIELYSFITFRPRSCRIKSTSLKK